MQRCWLSQRLLLCGSAVNIRKSLFQVPALHWPTLCLRSLPLLPRPRRSLVAILAFRFVVRVQLGETAGWVAFVFLQVRLGPGHALQRHARSLW